MNYEFLLNCFTNNFIGLRGLCDDLPAPLSGYYLDEIGGLNNNALTNLSNRETQFNALDFFRQKQETAIKLVCEELLQKLDSSNTFSPQIGINQDWAGAFQTTYHVQTLANREFGVQITANCDNLGCVSIPYIEVLLQNSGTITGKIVEGVYSTPFTFESVANQISRVNLNYSAKYECNAFCSSVPIQILIEDANGLYAPNKTALTYNSCGCGKSRNGFHVQGIDNGVLSSSTTYGIKVNMLVSCCLDNFFCSIKKRLGLPVLLKLAQIIYNEMLLSARLNGTTLSKKEEKESYIEYLDAKYNEALQAAVMQSNTIIKNYKSKCLPCTGAKIGILRS